MNRSSSPASALPLRPARRMRMRMRMRTHPRGWLARVCASLALLLSAAAAQAQPSPAQQRYDSEVGQCNRAGLPAPQREACLRDAGRQLDGASGSIPPALVPQTSADGRAEVMAPAGAPPPPSGPQFVPSPDGRAVLGVPPTGDRIERP